MSTPESCLFPDCPKVGVSRGLCRAHYASANRYVVVGRTTWARLIAAKKATHHRGKGAKTRDWFLGEVGQ